MLKALIALIPSAGVLFLFVLAIRAMLEGDRRERAAQARWDLEHGDDAGSGSGSGSGQDRTEPLR